MLAKLYFYTVSLAYFCIKRHEVCVNDQKRFDQDDRLLKGNILEGVMGLKW